MASQGIHSQAVGLTYSVLEPHVILAAGVSGTLLSECLRMHKSVISKNFEPAPCPNHDSHLAFGEIRPRAKLHKDSLAGRTQAWLVSPGKAVPRGPPSFSQHYSHGLCLYKRELIKKVRVRRAWAPGRTEDAGPCLWSKVPDKRLTNKALSQASGWPQGLGEESGGGGEGRRGGAPPRSSHAHLRVEGPGNTSYCKSTGLRCRVGQARDPHGLRGSPCCAHLSSALSQV